MRVVRLLLCLGPNLLEIGIAEVVEKPRRLCPRYLRKLGCGMGFCNYLIIMKKFCMLYLPMLIQMRSESAVVSGVR